MEFTVVIPARYESSRLPGKPLMEIAGMTMIEHVYRRALASSAHQVIVATDDPRIEEKVLGFGGVVVMTRNDHLSGTDRVEEAASQLGLNSDAIVINVQGDEPLIPPAVIDQVAAALLDAPEAGMATLCTSIDDAAELANPNIVKVVRNRRSMALYFSRAPIPWWRDGNTAGDPQLSAPAKPMRHLGIYAYRVDVLRSFVQWPPSSLELTESLEQLRALDNGVQIRCDPCCEPVPAGVDTEADLNNVRALLGEGAR